MAIECIDVCKCKECENIFVELLDEDIELVDKKINRRKR